MKKIAVIILLAALTFAGCKSFLEPTQIDLIYNEEFWKNQTDAEVGLSGVYALYRGIMVSGANWYQRADATTGFFKRGWNGGSSAQYYTPGNFTDVNSTSRGWGSLEGEASWAPFYKVIAQANLVIGKIEEIPENRFSGNAKKEILGEAYFLRALVYFDLMRIWGNAPYISELIESSKQVINNDLTPVLIPRTSDFEIGTRVLEDLEKSLAYLDYGTPGNSKWGIRANLGSAQTLAGHVNLWMHFLAQRDNKPAGVYLENAIRELEGLYTEGNYSYVDYDSADAVRSMYQGQSSEAVFELAISSDLNESYRADGYGITSFTCKLAPKDGDENKDKATYINFVPYAQKSVIYPEYDFATQTGDKRPHLFFDAWDSIYEDPINDTGGTQNDRSLVTWMTKYAIFSDDPNGRWDEYLAYFAEANIPVFRYTDAVLMLAEAYCKDNQPGKALAIVNEIRNRAGIGDYTGSNADLLDEVLQQRTSELIGEGHLYYDFVRNNWFPNRQIMPQDQYNQQGYYWPVAGSILTSNKLISQTPFWNGKTQW